MKITREFCDICGEEKKYSDWTCSLTPLVFTIYVSSQNPLGKYGNNWQTTQINFNETCDKCRRKIAEAITKALDERVALKNANAQST